MRGGHRYALSFYRQAGRPPALISALADLAELALPILRKHAQIRQMQDLLALSKLLARLALNFPKLTLQERNVCSRTLVSMTAEAIAIALGIGTSTVPTYRRRAYERYGISSASQLMPRRRCTLPANGPTMLNGRKTGRTLTQTGGVFGGQVTLATRTQDIHQPIHDLADIHRPLVAAAFDRWDLGCYQRPFLVGQVTRVTLHTPVVATAIFLRPHARSFKSGRTS